MITVPRAVLPTQMIHLEMMLFFVCAQQMQHFKTTSLFRNVKSLRRHHMRVLSKYNL